MVEDSGEVKRFKRFSFRVTVAATMTLEAGDAAAARDALGGLLDGAGARVTTRRGAVVELVDLSITRDVTLLRVDGIDPVSSLEDLLREFHEGEGDAG